MSLEPIKAALAAGPTPGPWRKVAPDRGYCIDYIVTDAPQAKDDTRFSDLVAETANVNGVRGSLFFEKDAAFIAACNPAAISELIAAFEAQERQLAELKVAAAVVVARWDMPSWKDVGPTAEVINALRRALQSGEAE